MATDRSMSPRLRKFALTTHVTSGVGWLGAVAAFLAIAVAGLATPEDLRQRAAYLAMDVSARYVIVPLTFASLISGLVQAVGTPWGLFRHYWVIVKLIITVLSTLILMLHMQPVTVVASAAHEAPGITPNLYSLRVQLVVNAAVALTALLVATTLSIYKPRGLTPYGWRKQQQRS